MKEAARQQRGATRSGIWADILGTHGDIIECVVSRSLRAQSNTAPPPVTFLVCGERVTS